MDSAVFDVLRNQTGRCDNSEKRAQDRHRAKRNVFQDLEFLLKSESRHENGTADQEQPEHQNNVENFLPCEFGQGVRRDREDALKGKGAMRSIHSLNPMTNDE